MAFKKSKLFAAIWEGCNRLRGGMDSTQYKDYVLTVLFVKYVSDKASDPKSIIEVPEGASFANVLALKGKDNIGEEINKILETLAKANDLVGVVDVVDFDDSAKLGSGKDKVERLSKLVSVFEHPDLDFAKHRAGGSDILGDAYEYLMKKFAMESGKSKGQFYTPGEVSIILAWLIGSHLAKQGETLYDPTCGSASLLLRCYSEAFESHGVELSVHGQEMDLATYGLSRINMVIHALADADIRHGSTMSSPKFLAKNQQIADGIKEAKQALKTFKYIVANPPFSDKAWSTGIDPENDVFGRFGFGVPPTKNGDYAFVQHILASLDADGKAAVVLPHGVLFRSNAEATIRKALIKKGWVRAIVGLPANLFFGTGIPACILLLDKEAPEKREGIYMIDASKGFMKDGNKNKLRARDMRKIMDAFQAGKPIDKYAKLVSYSEIELNDGNLNLPRYIDSSEPEDIHDLGGHLQGGIPQADIDSLANLWMAAPNLRGTLFRPLRPEYLELAVSKSDIKSSFAASGELSIFKQTVTEDFKSWEAEALVKFQAIKQGDRPRAIFNPMATRILEAFDGAALLDKYDVFQKLMELWEDFIQDDLFVVSEDGWIACREISELPPKSDSDFNIEIGSGKSRRRFNSEVIVPEMVAKRHFPIKMDAVAKKEAEFLKVEQEVEEAMEELGGEDAPLCTYIEDGKFMPAETESKPKQTAEEKAAAAAKKEADKALAEEEKQREKSMVAAMSKEEKAAYKVKQEQDKALRKTKAEAEALASLALKSGKDRLNAVADYEQEFGDDAKAVKKLLSDIAKAGTLKSEVSVLKDDLWSAVLNKFTTLAEDEIKQLVIEDKWLGRMAECVESETKRLLQSMVVRVEELAGRYETKLEDLEAKRAKLLQKTTENMKLLGF